MNEYYEGTYFCMTFSTSIDRMCKAFDKCGLSGIKWPDHVDIQLDMGEDEMEEYPASIDFKPSKGGLTLNQFICIAAEVMRDGYYFDFKIHADSGNPRFFWPTRVNGSGEDAEKNLGGFYLDENKIQAEAVMTISKIRDLCR